jgi:hypothetical protein
MKIGDTRAVHVQLRMKKQWKQFIGQAKLTWDKCNSSRARPPGYMKAVEGFPTRCENQKGRHWPDVLRV